MKKGKRIRKLEKANAALVDRAEAAEAAAEDARENLLGHIRAFDTAYSHASLEREKLTAQLAEAQAEIRRLSWRWSCRSCGLLVAKGTVNFEARRGDCKRCGAGVDVEFGPLTAKPEGDDGLDRYLVETDAQVKELAAVTRVPGGDQ
jgi:hypothetical protein